MPKLAKIVSAARFWLSRPMEGRDELIDMFVVRVREVLPAGVRVRAEHGIITIEGEREGMLRASAIMVGAVLREGMDVDDALVRAVEVCGSGVQEAVGAVTGAAWPRPDAKPGHRVDRDEVVIWWGVEGADDTVRLRPIRRDEIDLARR